MCSCNPLQLTMFSWLLVTVIAKPMWVNADIRMRLYFAEQTSFQLSPIMYVIMIHFLHGELFSLP